MKTHGASAPDKRFAAGKTLAQGQFICPEHFKSCGVPAKGEAFCGGIHFLL